MISPKFRENCSLHKVRWSICPFPPKYMVIVAELIQSTDQTQNDQPVQNVLSLPAFEFHITRCPIKRKTEPANLKTFCCSHYKKGSRFSEKENLFLHSSQRWTITAWQEKEKTWDHRLPMCINFDNYNLGKWLV